MLHNVQQQQQDDWEESAKRCTGSGSWCQPAPRLFAVQPSGLHSCSPFFWGTSYARLQTIAYPVLIRYGHWSRSNEWWHRWPGRRPYWELEADIVTVSDTIYTNFLPLSPVVVFFRSDWMLDTGILLTYPPIWLASPSWIYRQIFEARSSTFLGSLRYILLNLDTGIVQTTHKSYPLLGVDAHPGDTERNWLTRSYQRRYYVHPVALISIARFCLATYFDAISYSYGSNASILLLRKASDLNTPRSMATLAVSPTRRLLIQFGNRCGEPETFGSLTQCDSYCNRIASFHKLLADRSEESIGIFAT